MYSKKTKKKVAFEAKSNEQKSFQKTFFFQTSWQVLEQKALKLSFSRTDPLLKNDVSKYLPPPFPTPKQRR